MVFPQGIFSKASLQALDQEEFLAAVNSTIFPSDATPNEITFRDLLEMAVVRFGAPLFLRHYPDRLEKLALDLFLGKQVLIVEHHGFFKRGYEEAERCAAFVNAIAPDIQWTDLEDLWYFGLSCARSPGTRNPCPILRLRSATDKPPRHKSTLSHLESMGTAGPRIGYLEWSAHCLRTRVGRCPLRSRPGSCRGWHAVFSATCESRVYRAARAHGEGAPEGICAASSVRIEGQLPLSKHRFV